MRMTMFALSARIKPAGLATSPSVHLPNFDTVAARDKGAAQVHRSCC